MISSTCNTGVQLRLLVELALDATLSSVRGRLGTTTDRYGLAMTMSVFNHDSWTPMAAYCKCLYDAQLTSFRCTPCCLLHSCTHAGKAFI